MNVEEADKLLKNKVIIDVFRKEYTISHIRRWSNGTIVAYMKDCDYFSNIDILKDKETGKFLDEIVGAVV